MYLDVIPYFVLNLYLANLGVFVEINYPSVFEGFLCETVQSKISIELENEIYIVLPINQKQLLRLFNNRH
jgi:hypothetical protein